VARSNVANHCPGDGEGMTSLTGIVSTTSVSGL
jgi:hypothetical protein